MNRYALVPILGLALLTSIDTLAQESRAERRKNKNKAEEKEVVVDTLLAPIPMNRQMFTDRVDQVINMLDAKDGTRDGVIENVDPTKSRILTKAYLQDPKILKIKIENSTTTHAQKIGFHRALENRLRSFNQVIDDNIDAVYHRQLMQNFSDMMMAVINGTALDFVKANANIYSLRNVELLDGNAEARAYVYRTVGLQNPEMMLKYLDKIGNEPYTDEIIAAAARVAPVKVSDYAISKYGYVIQRNQDKLVRTIVDISLKSKNRTKVLPFLNQINDGEMTIAEVDKLAMNNDSYFKSLVALKISGKATSAKAIEDEIAYRALDYVRKVNELHEKPDAVRFKSVEDFEPEAYYFMLLGGETNEIYTSSYLGIFKRMMAKMGTRSGYDLMQTVRMSNFRTFIRMAAGYNTASTFLKTMSEQEKTTLLRDFVGGLEKGSRSDLKDAVDVADAFGSLTDEALLKFLKKEVEENYERVYKDKKLSKEEASKGVIVYGLLASIFNSSDNPEQLQGAVSEIPPINYVEKSSLVNEQGQTIAQVFFYGDEDGVMSYSSFLQNFRTKGWKIDESNSQWTTITSTEGKPVIYYANKPLKEPLDEEAQNKLAIYLDANEIRPTVVIHRGHSYHLEGSLKNLTPDVKVVMLGSCGGFHNLSNVLDKAPDAHIISTKQIGSMYINDPIIKSMNEYFLSDKNLNWIEMWANLSKFFATKSNTDKERFSDYIPPNRNLGAIFIKAYRKIELANQS
jgi:hypothetical protein